MDSGFSFFLSGEDGAGKGRRLRREGEGDEERRGGGGTGTSPGFRARFVIPFLSPSLRSLRLLVPF